jgi:hypothetical protein
LNDKKAALPLGPEDVRRLAEALLAHGVRPASPGLTKLDALRGGLDPAAADPDAPPAGPTTS